MKKDTILKYVEDSRLRYLFVGGSSVLIEYGSFVVLIKVALSGVVIANIVSFLIGLTYTFLLHNRWTFKGSHKHSIKKQLIAYGTLATINVIATSLIIDFLVQEMHIPALIAKLLCMALVIVWNYLLLSRFIFKRVLDDESAV